MLDLRRLTTAAHHIATFLPQATLDDRVIGKWIFTGLFGVLIVWLLLIPRERLGQRDRVPRWWRNVRFWAVVIATIQLLVYAIWG